VSDKQAKLLSQDVGHFSLVRALHLADLITELNGMLFSHELFPLLPALLLLFFLLLLLFLLLLPCLTWWADTGEQPGFCGVMSVMSSLRYCTQDNPHNYTNLYWALAFIPLGLFFDFMDGKVARWRGKASLMGQELDSLADLVRRSLSFSPSPQKRFAHLPHLVTTRRRRRRRRRREKKRVIINSKPGILWRLSRRRRIQPRPPHPT